MTEQEYRNHPAISRSELWRIRESPEKFRYFREHPEPPTPALLLGQVLHKLLLEPETFAEEFAVAPAVNRRTNEGKQRWAEFEEQNSGRTVVPPELYEQALAMRDAVLAEPLALKLLDGSREVPFFWEDDLTGEPCKCRADCLNTNYSRPIAVDVKSTADAGTEAFSRDAVKYGYDFQAAMYSDGIAKNIGQTPLFVFIAVEKAPPYAVNILQADGLLLRRGRGLFREYMDIYHDCRVTGNWYGYLGKKKQINNLALPTWAAREVEQEEL